VPHSGKSQKNQLQGKGRTIYRFLQLADAYSLRKNSARVGVVQTAFAAIAFQCVKLNQQHKRFSLAGSLADSQDHQIPKKQESP
jgi:hypothetical protein